MINVFEEIKSRVPLADVFDLYSLHPNRSGYVCCPIHTEKTPSLRLYPEHWHCFGCHAGGDGVKLVQFVDNLTPIEAARKLSDMFHLNLFPDRPLTKSERRKLETAARQRKQAVSRVEAFEEWERRACSIWATYCRMLEHWRREYAPKTPEDDFHPLFCEALRKLDYADYIYHEIFVSGDFEEKARFYQTHRQEVRAIEQYIRKSGFVG